MGALFAAGTALALPLASSSTRVKVAGVDATELPAEATGRALSLDEVLFRGPGRSVAEGDEAPVVEDLGALRGARPILPNDMVSVKRMREQ